MTEILLFHHALGLTPGVTDFADRLREAGHTVHTPDLYEGHTFRTVEEGVGYARETGFGTILEKPIHDAYPDRFQLSPTLANYADGKDEIVVREQAPLSQEELLETALEALADEIHHLLQDGVVADAKDVDTALLLGAGWPFWLGGITKYLDQVGISGKMFGHPLAETGAGAPTP